MEQKKTNEREPLPATFAEAMGDGFSTEEANRAASVRVEGPIGEKTSDGALNATENEPAPAAQVVPPAAQTNAVAPIIKEKAVVLLNEQGLPMPKDFDAAYRVADAMHKGGAFPKWVRNAMQALAVSQFCRSLKLDPMTGVQHVCEINGRLALWGEGPLAAVRSSGQLDSIKEVFLTKDYKEICLANKNLDAELFAVSCTIVRKHADGRLETVERAFTNKDEAKALKGLADVWKGYQRIMYKRKARAEAIKDLFGDVIAGARIAEYDDNFAPDQAHPDGAGDGRTLAQRIEDRTSEKVAT